MDFAEAQKIIAERIKSPCEDWTTEQKGRALEMIRLLAVTPWREWRSRRAIHAALAEFRADQ